MPAVSVTGVRKVKVFRPPAPPSLKPGIVAEARSGPVGTGVAPVVFRIESARVGLAAVQPEQNSSTSTRLSCPVTVGVNVCPAQLVFVKPKPVGLTLLFLAAVLSGLARTTFEGLLTRSQLFGTPRCQSACVLSVKQPACDEAPRLKFRVAVPPSGTAIVATEDGSKPALLAVRVGYVPAGSVNAYCPLALVVAVRLPSVNVTPASGFVPSVTRPESVPLPTLVQPGKWNDPIRV